MVSWKAVVQKSPSYQESDRRKYWQYYHDRNNHILARHLCAHTMLLGIAVQERSFKEVLRQSWLSIAVIPVHLRSVIRERSENLS